MSVRVCVSVWAWVHVSGRVFSAHIALLIQHATRIRHIVCGPSGSTIFFNIMNGMIFGKKFTEHKISVFIFPTHFIWNISHSKMNSERYYHKYEKYPLFLSDFNETWIFLRDFRIKSSNIKFIQNPSSGSRVVPRGRTEQHDEANSRFSQLCAPRIGATPWKMHSCDRFRTAFLTSLWYLVANVSFYEILHPVLNN